MTTFLFAIRLIILVVVLKMMIINLDLLALKMIIVLFVRTNVTGVSSEHKSRPYELVDYMDYKIRYYDSKNQLDVKTQLLMGIKNNLIKLNLECMSTQ